MYIVKEVKFLNEIVLMRGYNVCSNGKLSLRVLVNALCCVKVRIFIAQ